MRKMRGFTLIELMVVMAIIAVLALLIIGGITIARHASMETVNRNNGRNIHMALIAFESNGKKFCPIGTLACSNGTMLAADTVATALQNAGYGTNILASGSSAHGGVDVDLSTSCFAIYIKNWDLSKNIDTISCN